jgi:hypothetical protein
MLILLKEDVKNLIKNLFIDGLKNKVKMWLNHILIESWIKLLVEEKITSKAWSLNLISCNQSTPNLTITGDKYTNFRLRLYLLGYAVKWKMAINEAT